MGLFKNLIRGVNDIQPPSRGLREPISSIDFPPIRRMPMPVPMPAPMPIVPPSPLVPPRSIGDINRFERPPSFERIDEFRPILQQPPSPLAFEVAQRQNQVGDGMTSPSLIGQTLRPVQEPVEMTPVQLPNLVTGELETVNIGNYNLPAGPVSPPTNRGVPITDVPVGGISAVPQEPIELETGPVTIGGPMDLGGVGPTPVLPGNNPPQAPFATINQPVLQKMPLPPKRDDFMSIGGPGGGQLLRGGETPTSYVEPIRRISNYNLEQFKFTPDDFISIGGPSGGFDLDERDAIDSGVPTQTSLGERVVQPDGTITQALSASAPDYIPPSRDDFFTASGTAREPVNVPINAPMPTARPTNALPPMPTPVPEPVTTPAPVTPPEPVTPPASTTVAANQPAPAPVVQPTTTDDPVVVEPPVEPAATTTTTNAGQAVNNPFAASVTQRQTTLDPITQQLLFGLDGQGGFIPGAMRAAEKTFYDDQGNPIVIDEQVAGFSPDQLAAMQMQRQAVGQQDPYLQTAAGAYGAGTQALEEGLQRGRTAAIGSLAATRGGLGSLQQGLGESADILRGTVGGYDPSMTERFYDPYEDRVVQQTISDIMEQGAKSDIGARAGDIARGGESAFGSRARLGASERQRAIGRGLAEALGGIRSQGFRQAQQTGLGEFARQKAAERAASSGLAGLAGQGFTGQQALAGALSGLGQTEQNIGQQRYSGQFGLGSSLQGLGAQAAGASASDIAALYGMGAQQQGQTQQMLDAQRRNLQQRQMTPLLQYQALQPFVSMAPAGQFQTDTQFVPAPSPVQAGMGVGLSAFGALGQLYGGKN